MSPPSRRALRAALRSAETAQHLVPGVGCVADLEALEGLGGESAAGDVVARARLMRERLGVKVRHVLHHIVERLVRAARRVIAAALVRHLKTQTGGELFHRFGEGHVVVVHEEAEHRAVLAAAEAVIELLVRAHPEGGRLFAVERAAGLVLASGLFQLHAQPDDFHDVRAGNEFVDEVLRDASQVLAPCVLCGESTSRQACHGARALAAGKISRVSA